MNAIDVRYNYCNVGGKVDTNSTGSRRMKEENIKQACHAGCPYMYEYKVTTDCIGGIEGCYKCWKNSIPNKEWEGWGKRC